MKKLAVLWIAFGCSALWAAADVPVPANCTPQVNQKLFQLIRNGQQKDVFNVMVCGITSSPSRTQHGGPHGDHQILSLRVAFPDGSQKLVEVVTNDALDGKVTAPANARVFAYGRAFFSNTHQYAAGLDEVHCATNPRADNGWVVVNGKRYPSSC
jgi:hypothetical protein